MKTFKVFLLLFFLLPTSCTNMEFVYNDSGDLTNPLYKNVIYTVEGNEIPYLKRYLMSILAKSNDPNYKLSIYSSEEKVKRSVKQNQVVAKLDYQIEIKYVLENLKIKCLINEKTVISRFSYTPKSDGYNFGSDKSLENLYKLSANNNLNNYIKYISDINLLQCANES